MKPATASLSLILATSSLWAAWTAALLGTAPQMNAGSAAPAADAAEASPGTGVTYPGPSPGRASIALQDPAITVSNAALSAVWTLTPQGLRPHSFRAEPSGRSLSLTGEVFQVVLSNGTRYAASALAPEGKPQMRPQAPKLKAARLAARLPTQAVELPLRSPDGQLRVLWRALAPDGANYIRQEIEVTAARETLALKEVIWLAESIPGARTAGQVDGSPVVAAPFFLGVEDPMALNKTEPDFKLPPDGRVESFGHVHVLGWEGALLCRLRRDAPLRRGETFAQSFVLGVAPPGQMRRGFLYYLERERAHPFRPFLHYNSWYDIAWQPFALNETNCLEAIRLWGDRFIRPYGVAMDALVFDDGWDDPKTLWQFHAGFPNGFQPLADLCRHYDTRLGAWLSPFGGYGEPREQRLKSGREKGYEINAAGFSLAGPKYYEAFKQACVGMIRQYGVNHFKFDGIAAGTYAQGGADYILDTEAMRRLMLELRQEDPSLYINLTTGSWPSPFWLRFADSLWRQGGDMGLAGPGSKQQQWLTYRDQETFRNVVCNGPLYPLNALMTQGVAYSRHGSAGEPSFNAAGFKDDVRAFFGGGTGLQELYIQPAKLTDADWKVLAEAGQWSRANADVLVDTHWIGGDPSKLQVYGYASWSPRKGIVMLRNPDGQPHEFDLELRSAFELPDAAPTRYALKSPWAEDAARPALTASAGSPLRLSLQPFEVVVFDAFPGGPAHQK